MAALKICQIFIIEGGQCPQPLLGNFWGGKPKIVTLPQSFLEPQTLSLTLSIYLSILSAENAGSQA